MTSIAILDAVNTTAVQFHGQPIITAMAAGIAYVAMKPIVENLGMSWGTQQQKLMKCFDKFNCIHMNMVAADGKIRKLLCLPLKKLNGWLFSINPERVRADIKDKLIQYQEECFSVLYEYWTKGEVSNPRKAPKKEVTAHYLVSVRIRDEITGGQVELNLAAESFVSLVTGISTCLGYEPIGFNKVPVQKSMLRQIH